MKNNWAGQPNKGMVSSSYKKCGSSKSLKPLTVRLSPATISKINTLSSKNGISKAKVVRELIKRELRDFK